jgi:hypothetical protein
MDLRTIERSPLVHVADFSVVNVHVDELSSARIWQHKLCATFSANVNINYRLPIKVYYLHGRNYIEANEANASYRN